MNPISRRTAVRLSASAAALAVVSGQSAFASQRAAEIIARFAAGSPIHEGGMTIDLPDEIEDGSTVPITVSADSPMTEADHVTEIVVVSEGNPLPRLATFRFSPLSGRAEASTRIRLAQAQDVVALARTSTGQVLSARKRIEVTIGACTG